MIENKNTLNEVTDMTIKEVEEKTDLARSNIRFYEKEKLIAPSKNERNGYKEYTNDNVRDIKKIAYLRTLGLSIEQIRKIRNHEVTLNEIISGQEQLLDEQISDLKKAKAICKKMAEENIDYDKLNIEAYVPKLSEYWYENQKIFKRDVVRFIFVWGKITTWGMITAVSLLLALLVYPYLPTTIPIQWSNGVVTSEVAKIFIFVYPFACVVIRFLLGPYIWRWTMIHFKYGDAVSNYITNYICFIALSAEFFTVLYVLHIVTQIEVLFLIDTLVLIGILFWGVHKLR